MIADETRKKLEDIIRGAGYQEPGNSCTTIRNILSESFETSATVKGAFESRAIIKEKQAGFLKAYAKQEGLWLHTPPPSKHFIARGGEAEVYLSPGKRDVIKVNDAIYYATWTEFFNSLVIHNLLFPGTTYSLAGFLEIDDCLKAVLQQPYIEGEQAELTDINELLLFNGFTNTKRHDKITIMKSLGCC